MQVQLLPLVKRSNAGVSKGGMLSQSLAQQDQAPSDFSKPIALVQSPFTLLAQSRLLRSIRTTQVHLRPTPSQHPRLAHGVFARTVGVMMCASVVGVSARPSPSATSASRTTYLTSRTSAQNA